MALRRLTPPDGGPGTSDHVLTHDGLPRAYRVHLPPRLPMGAPVVIQLHGGGGNGKGLDRLTRFHPLADRECFAVVSPSGYDRYWNDGRVAPGGPRSPGAAADGRVAPGSPGSPGATAAGSPGSPGATAAGSPGSPGSPGSRVDDVGFLAALIDCLAGWLPIDRRRVYAVGISNGAMMAARLAAARPERIAAIGQVAGTASADAGAWWHPPRPVPVVQIHGTADPIVPYQGGAVQIRRRRGPNPGRVLGVDQWADLLVAHNLAAGPEVSTPAPGVTRRTWRGPTPQADVQFWRVGGGGHTWPGGTQYLSVGIVGPTSTAFDATAAIWQFLAAHILET